MATKPPATTDVSLEDRIAILNAEGWRPTVGDLFERAQVIGFDVRHSEDYASYPVVIYRLADGKVVAVHVMHQVLRDQYREIGPTVGQFHNLKYLGRRTGNKVKANGETTEYEMYFVENADAPRVVSTEVPIF